MNPSRLMRFAWIIVAYFAVLALSRNDLEEGYYWREYTGDVPRDALSGTLDKSGRHVYIAQTVHDVTYPSYRGQPRIYPGYPPYEWSDNVHTCTSPVVVTGQIREGQKNMEYEWGYGKQEAQKNVQVLCTHHPEHFEWVETNRTEIANLQGRHLVSGGVEKDYTMYIGRATFDGQVVIGRVLSTKGPGWMDGFYGPQGVSYVYFGSLFDVLVYNPGK